MTQHQQNMRIIEVVSNQQIQSFLRFPHDLYSNDPEWVSPLEIDIEQVFDRNENSYYAEGDAKRWILVNDQDKTIGRIAAFHFPTYYKTIGRKVGGIGFFECIHNQEAAFILFDTAKQWLITQGMTAMDGPINFGERDRFWGLMVSGFKHPSYHENYNPPYYKTFFEQYGFKTTIEQSTSEIAIADFNFERFNRISQRVLTNPNYSFRHFELAKLESFANDFMTIYNQAWSHRPDFVQMTQERVTNILKSIKPILMEDIIWFAYANNEPAGFYINVIDVNQIFKHLKGKMNLWAKLKFLWYRKFGTVNRIRGIVFGVIPQYQNLGLETGMIIKTYNAFAKHPHIKTAELAWIGDFNPKMHSLFDALGAKKTKVHHTMRVEF